MLESLFFRAEKLDIFASKVSPEARGQKVMWLACVTSVYLTRSKTWRKARENLWRKEDDTVWSERPTVKAVRIHNIRRESPRICSLPSLVLGLIGLNSFVDIVLIFVSQSANLHLCVQLILSRVALPTAWRLRCQEWKELKWKGT